MRQVNMRFALLCSAFVVAAVAAQGGQPPELILTNARIYTLDPARPWAEAVAVSGSRILAVGSATEIAPLAGASTRTIDLKGAFVAPGFNDAHVHIDSTGGLLVGVNLLEVHEAKAFT
jgi:predicted amidohydrolase YtcJ